MLPYENESKDKVISYINNTNITGTSPTDNTSITNINTDNIIIANTASTSTDSYSHRGKVCIINIFWYDNIKVKMYLPYCLLKCPII